MRRPLWTGLRILGSGPFVTTRDLIIESAEYRLDSILADQDEIRRWLPHRHELEQLTAIVHVDIERRLCVGYKDVGHDEFWARGHFPGSPLMPGVVMCEAAAQMAAYFCSRYNLMGGKVIGLAGLDEVRIRGPVRPGDRLVIACAQHRIRAGVIIICQFQCLVNDQLVAEGFIRGAPLPDDILAEINAANASSG